jgi:hypothetical protein
LLAAIAAILLVTSRPPIYLAVGPDFDDFDLQAQSGQLSGVICELNVTIVG